MELSPLLFIMAVSLSGMFLIIKMNFFLPLTGEPFVVKHSVFEFGLIVFRPEERVVSVQTLQFWELSDNLNFKDLKIGHNFRRVYISLAC